MTEPGRLETRTPWEITRAVHFALLMRELKTRFGAYRLGYAWVLLEPMAHVAVLALIFGYFVGRTMPGIDFTLFLITGIVPWMLFMKTVERGMAAVSSNSGLFGYRQVKPIDAFLARSVLEFLIYAGVFMVLILLAYWYGLEVRIDQPLNLAAAFVALFLFSVSLALTLCVIVTLFPESQKFIKILLKPLYFMSGIFFSLRNIPAEYHVYLLWNPVLHAIELTRDAFFYQYSTDGGSFEVLIAYTCILSVLGLALYRQNLTRMVAT
ncbi:MAG: ABC transporter permease [Thiotrichales bacterium]